ncbi:MAG TPA: hypothetical protein VM511_07720 [Luteolibacter sp.]|nr:hypothetical protein [Luteolibacter sp.]
MIRCFSTALFLASTGFSSADHIMLNGEGRLSGTVKSINADGVVELASPLAPDPVFLRSDAVRKVTFGEGDQAGKIPTSRLELNNGDILPVEVESLDEKQIQVVSPVAGKLTIPRTSLKSLMLGIHPNRVVYSGPKSEDDLKPEGPQAENWSYDEGVLLVEGGGRAARKLEPLKQFIVRFTMEWHNNPTIQFYFADPLAPSTQTIADRYYFQFNASGMELKRESVNGGKRFTSFASLNRRPDQFPGSRLKVEIRVDRPNSLLYLFLNDEPEGRFKDPVETPPQGGGIAFVSSAGNDTEVRFSGIEVLEWDPQGDRYRTEDRGDPKADSMIERRGDRFGGKLLSIGDGGNGKVFRFKSDFQDAPIELPESEISTIFFSEPEAKEAAALHPFALRLQGEGIVRVSSCSFPGDRIEAVHPLLGPLLFSREGVTALERLDLKGGKP